MRIKKDVITFILISYLSCYFIFKFICSNEIPDFSNPLEIWKAFLLMSTPTLSAFLTSYLFKIKLDLKEKLKFRVTKWTFLSLVLPIIIMIGSSIASTILFSDIRFNSDFTGAVEFNKSLSFFQSLAIKDGIIANKSAYFITNFIQSISFGWSTSAFLAFGEEFGWRGFLMERLRNYSESARALIIGSIWGFWHFPLILKGYNFPENPELGVLMMMVSCISLSLISNLLKEKTKTAFAPAIFHGSFNNFIWLSLAPLTGNMNSFRVGLFGLSGIISSLVVFFFLKTLTASKKST